MMRLLNTLRDETVKRILLPSAFLCCAMLFCAIPLFAAESITFYFHSSETNINNFKSLKTEFDSYLSKFGPYEFQPFDDRATFEQHVRGKKNCLLFLSSWHYNNIYKPYALHPSLVGLRNGKNSQKRVLVGSASGGDLNSAMKGPVAAASSPQHTKSMLKDIFPDKGAADSVRVLSVPKDIDALMSVGFGMSKCALITENALDNLKMLDPGLYATMKPLSQGKESLLLILAVPTGFSQDAEKIIDMIKNLPNDPDGMNVIKMLDLDGWKLVDPSDKSKLEG